MLNACITYCSGLNTREKHLLGVLEEHSQFSTSTVRTFFLLEKVQWKIPSWNLTATFSYIGQYHYEEERDLELFPFSDNKTKPNANGQMLCLKHFWFISGRGKHYTCVTAWGVNLRRCQSLLSEPIAAELKACLEARSALTTAVRLPLGRFLPSSCLQRHLGTPVLGCWWERFPRGSEGMV